MSIPPIGRSSSDVPWPPRVQVAGVSSLAECVFCHSVGVDAVGFTLELPTGIHDGLTRARAADIVQHLPRGLVPVVITYLTGCAEVSELAEQTHARAVQFHGGVSQDEIAAFRKRSPHVLTIGRVTVSGAHAIEEAGAFLPHLWDAIILDSRDPITGRIGATGLTHDWSISEKIVRAAAVPVILAGGLDPNNVAEAIRAVKPAGVDAHTGLEDPDGSRSFAKIQAFARAAREAFGA